MLLALARQTTRPASVIVSTDGLSQLTDDNAHAFAQNLHAPLGFVDREYVGASRSSQTRNNGVRALLDFGADAQDRLVFLDGDCCPREDLLATYVKLLRGRAVALGHRIDLTARQTELFDPRRPFDERLVTSDQWLKLEQRHRRLTRQKRLRKLGIGKPHKPKLLSANFGVALGDYQHVNGFDETYEQYGQEDDDIARRLYACGCTPTIGTNTLITYHRHHPTRAPTDWHDSPNAARLAQKVPVRCENGLDAPVEQPEVRLRWFGPEDPQADARGAPQPDAVTVNGA